MKLKHLVLLVIPVFLTSCLDTIKSEIYSLVPFPTSSISQPTSSTKTTSKTSSTKSTSKSTSSTSKPTSSTPTPTSQPTSSTSKSSSEPTLPTSHSHSSSESSSHTHTTSTVSTSSYNPGIIYDEFQIHFLELGNWYTGDSIYIKAGDNDILIDAGSRYSSGEYIKSYLDANGFVKDGKFEYVIATHAHEDHISGFSGGAGKKGIFYNYKVDTLIEFAKTGTASAVLTNYNTAKEKLVAEGTKVYTALEAYNSPSLRKIKLGENIYMSTLYQKYYELEASTENNYSVCTLFTYSDQNYLFTGDLESPGETSLVESNELPHCQLYKAGHHGSKTSSNKKLMQAISPEVICVCCCCGSDEYTTVNENQFPTQEFINRVAPYTDQIYVTSISTNNEEKTYSSMNGTIIFSSNGGNYAIWCSNNDIILKNTDWFKANRTWPEAV